MNIFVCSSNREEGGVSFSCNHFFFLLLFVLMTELYGTKDS